jgi:ubiquinol oxidase
VDNWIKVLLDEAENERMHLMTFISIKKVTRWEKFVILFTQAIFFDAYLLFYLFFPKTAHRFVGYLEVLSHIVVVVVVFFLILSFSHSFLF